MTEWLKRDDAETTTSVAVHSSVRSDTKVQTMKPNRSASFRSLCQCRHYMLVQIYRTEQHQLVLEVAAFLFQFLRDVTQLTVQRFHVTRLYKRQEKELQPLAHNYSAEFRYFQDNSWSSRHCPAMPGTNYKQWYVSGLPTMKLLPSTDILWWQRSDLLSQYMHKYSPIFFQRWPKPSPVLIGSAKVAQIRVNNSLPTKH